RKHRECPRVACANRTRARPVRRLSARGSEPAMNFDASSPPILVTGASGLIGSRLCAALAPRGPVVALDKDEPKRRVAAIDFVRCDLTSDAEVERALGEIRARHGGALTSVVHLAAYYDFSGEPSPLYERSEERRVGTGRN